MCLLYYSYYYHTEYFTLDTSGNKYQKQYLCDTSWVSNRSDSIYLEIASEPTGERVSPTRLSPSHFRCQLQVGGLQVAHNFCQTRPEVEVLRTPSSGSINLLEQLIELQETLTLVNLLKNIIKVIN